MQGTDISATRRAVCLRCLRPQRTCICQWVVLTDTKTELLILQHPLEVGHAKGSAQLLHLSLSNSRLVVGETFNETLHQLLYALTDSGEPFVKLFLAGREQIGGFGSDKLASTGIVAIDG